ncbi:hypothetical protein [Faecalibacillus faecis]|uniref:hypothetical protein n=1 Tax=Faecalibacillus faecis TaxID=1982628 RepID=UPI002F9303EC
MTAQEMFEALHKSQIKAKRLMRKNKKLKRRFNKLNRALDKACKNWEGEVPDCDFLVMLGAVNLNRTSEDFKFVWSLLHFFLVVGMIIYFVW